MLNQTNTFKKFHSLNKYIYCCPKNKVEFLFIDIFDAKLSNAYSNKQMQVH